MSGAAMGVKVAYRVIKNLSAMPPSSAKQCLTDTFTKIHSAVFNHNGPLKVVPANKYPWLSIHVNYYYVNECGYQILVSANRNLRIVVILDFVDSPLKQNNHP